MKILNLWKAGFGILVRLAFLSFLLHLGFFPFLFSSDSLVGFSFAVIYFLFVFPVILPGLLDIAGLKTKEQSEVDGGGGMNESAREKQDELRMESRMQTHGRTKEES